MSVDPASDVAPYEQVRARITAAVDSGELPIGFRLPPVRRLAADLGLAPNTVARAYRELELAGTIETRGRHGSFVAGPPGPDRDRLLAAARRYVGEVAALGVDAAEGLAVVRREFEHCEHRTAGR